MMLERLSDLVADNNKSDDDDDDDDEEADADKDDKIASQESNFRKFMIDMGQLMDGMLDLKRRCVML